MGRPRPRSHRSPRGPQPPWGSGRSRYGATAPRRPPTPPRRSTAPLTGTGPPPAVARDTTGNRAPSAPVSVTVSNTPPVLSAVSTYKYVLNIAATVGPTAVPAGYSVPVTFNHANLVSAGKSM